MTGSETPVQPNLRDIGPTALQSLGCPLPSDMDGRLIAEIFNGGSESRRQGSAYKSAGAAVDPVYTEDEETQLRDRLRALGYIE